MWISVSDELKREGEFYRSRGLSCPKDILANSEMVDIKKSQNENLNDTDFHQFDEQVSFSFFHFHTSYLLGFLQHFLNNERILDYLLIPLSIIFDWRWIYV